MFFLNQFTLNIYINCIPVKHFFVFNASTHSFQQAVGDELHYAELSIAMQPRSSAANVNLLSGGSVHPPLMVGGGLGHHHQQHQPLPPPPPSNHHHILPGDSSSLPRKPPAYDYFDEPTIYAQIDHYKTLSTATVQQLHQQQQQSTIINGAMSPTSYAATTTATSPASSSTVSTSLYPSKTHSREIVTIRTPLIYTQQESCV